MKADELRRRAEKIITEQPEIVQELPVQDIQELINELQIHQVELEMQNDELRKAHLELEASRKKYYELYDFAPVGYFTLNENGIIREVNLAGAQLVGVERRYVVGCGFSRFLDPESQERFFYYRKKAEETGLEQNCEIKLIQRNGISFYMQLQMVPVTDEENKETCYQVTVADITDRKRAEDEIKKSHELLEHMVEERTKELLKRKAQYRMLADNVSDVIWTADLDLHFSYLSPSVERLLGYSSNEILQISMSKILPPASLKTVLDLGKKFREGVERIEDKKRLADSQTIELDLIRKDGKLICAETTLTFICGNGNSPDMVLGVTRDITRRKQAENERWESEHRYHLFVESSPIGILFYDTQLHLIDCNARFESFSKVNRESLIGFDLNTLNDKKMIQILRESLEGKGGVFEGLYKMTISGDEMWIDLKSAPVFNIDGTVIGGVTVIEDITERVLAKQALEKSKAELEVKARHLEETNTALRVLLERIEEDKIEIQENVLSNVRHLILPLVEKIKVRSSKTEIDNCVDVLERSLNNIVSPFLRNMSLKHYHLTPKEMQVANLVKEGKTNKEIAALMNVSSRSVEVHRDNIRGKLDIKNKKANLRSILLSMS